MTEQKLDTANLNTNKPENNQMLEPALNTPEVVSNLQAEEAHLREEHVLATASEEELQFIRQKGLEGIDPHAAIALARDSLREA